MIKPEDCIKFDCCKYVGDAGCLDGCDFRIDKGGVEQNPRGCDCSTVEVPGEDTGQQDGMLGAFKTMAVGQCPSCQEFGIILKAIRCAYCAKIIKWV